MAEVCQRSYPCKKDKHRGIKKLLEYAPCWEITTCPDERKLKCTAFMDKTKPCWELNRMICNQEAGKDCEECVVYIARPQQEAAASLERFAQSPPSALIF